MRESIEKRDYKNEGNGSQLTKAPKSRQTKSLDTGVGVNCSKGRPTEEIKTRASSEAAFISLAANCHPSPLIPKQPTNPMRMPNNLALFRD